MSVPIAYESAIGIGVREAAFGVQQSDASLTDWFPTKEADLAETEVMWETDEDEITGAMGATKHTVFERKGSISRKCKATLEHVVWALMMMFGNVATTGTTPNFTSTIRWRDKCTLNPFSFSFLEGLSCAGSTGTLILYKGCIVETITLEFNGKGPGSLTLGLKHDGSETAKPSATLPVSWYVSNALFGNMLNVKLGPLGTEDITGIARSWKMTITMGSVEPPSLSSSGIYVAEQQYGLKNPKIDVEIVAHFDKSHAIYGYSQGATPTTVKHIAAITVNADRSLVLTQSSGKVQVSVKPVGSEFQGTIKFLEEFNTTDGTGGSYAAGKFVAKTGQGTWLVASP